MNILKQQDGVTLLEMLAAITLFSMIIGIVVMLPLQTQTTSTNIMTKSHALNQASYLTQHITSQMRSFSQTLLGVDDPDDDLLLGFIREDSDVRYLYDEATDTISVQLTNEGGETQQVQLADNISDVAIAFEPVTQRLALDLTFTLSNGQTFDYETAIYARNWDEE